MDDTHSLLLSESMLIPVSHGIGGNPRDILNSGLNQFAGYHLAIEDGTKERSLRVAESCELLKILVSLIQLR